jgi:hypothetical protein
VTSKYGDLALQVGGVSDETENMAVSSVGLRPKSDCYGKALKPFYSNLQTRPLVKEGAKNYKPATVYKKFQGERKIGHGSQTGAWHQDRLAHWLSVVN